MQEFQIYLWKEWREQRALLAALAGALLVATLAIGALLDRQAIESTFTYEGILVLCVGGALFTVGSDLFTRERQLGRLQFLERLPGGLSAAFHGKLVFFLLVVAAALVYGMLLGALCGFVFTGKVPPVRMDPARGQIAVLLFPAALWVFAVSTWVPVSVLTVPSSVLLAALFLLPAWLLLRAAEIPLPQAGAFWVLSGALTLGALVCARLSFVHAAARSRPKRIALWSGLVTGLVAFVPCTAWAGWHYAEWLNWPYRLHSVLIGPGGQFGFINLVRLPPERAQGQRVSTSALVLDLETLDLTQEGTVDRSIFVDGYHLMLDVHRGPRIALYEDGNGDKGLVYDAATGLPTDSTVDLSHRIQPYEPADFGLERFPGLLRFEWAGLGQVALCLDENDIRTIFLRTPGSAGAWRIENPHGRREVRALNEGILVRDQHVWSWLDPDTGVLDPFEHLADGELLGATLADGRLLVHATGVIAILDPGTGCRDELEIHAPGRWSGRIEYAWLGKHSQRGAPLAADRQVVVLLSLYKHGSHRRGLALLDVPRNQLRLADWYWGTSELGLTYWSKGARAIVVEDEQRLVHYDFETDERRVLMDVNELRP